MFRKEVFSVYGYAKCDDNNQYSGERERELQPQGGGK